MKKTTDKSPDVNLDNSNGNSSSLISNVVLKGDLASLSDSQKIEYYFQLCYSLGLNPTSKPFEIIKFNGKEILYAKREATEQLRKIHGVSVVELILEVTPDLCIARIRVQNKEGRFDVATGVVPLTGLKGDAKANAIMRAETKAKRRATLSICGLGMLDESETDTIGSFETKELSLPQTENPYKLLAEAKTLEELRKVWEANPLLQREPTFANLKNTRKEELADISVNDILPEEPLANQNTNDK